MSDYLFVYGTLQPRLAPREIADAVAKLTHIGGATVRGLLYDLGEFPGAILDPASELTISGTVFKLPDDPRILAHFDRYEEFDPDSLETSQFIRVSATVTLESGGKLQCWVYVYNRDLASAAVLKSGRFPQT